MAHAAFRWEADGGRGRLTPLLAPAPFDLDDLVGVERPLAELLRNTEQFLLGLPAQHVLLYGERGTGKSSAVRGLLTRFGARGLRLVEVRKTTCCSCRASSRRCAAHPSASCCSATTSRSTKASPATASSRPRSKAGLELPPENVRILATSNRRHLVPEKRSENRAVRVDEDGELHVGEALEEKLSLSDRFGLVLGFFGFDQPTYLAIVERHARRAGVRLDASQLRDEALRWALDRASRSGRTARQFVDDLAGRLALEADR